MRIAVPRERLPGELRVALTPDVVARLARQGHEIVVEAGAGDGAAAPDATYVEAGARIASTLDATTKDADLVVRVNPPSLGEVDAVPSGATLVSFLFPTGRLDVVRAAADRRVNLFALDLVPRITRAQTMDALSSMSTVAGYRAALLAAWHLPRFVPMLMTAAGTIAPSRIVVCGVGVAGLQAIATCRRLGAIVEAYDVRAEAREQARSLGAETIEVDLGEAGEGVGGYARELSDEARRRLEAALAERVKKADAVITTALIPGRPAPRLIDEMTVAGMRQGAVVVDLAAESGGNVAGTVAGEIVRVGGVTLVGLTNLPASMPVDASRMFARNMQDVVRHLTPPKAADGAPSGPAVHLDLDDEITAGALAVHGGVVRHEPTRQALGVAS